MTVEIQFCQKDINSKTASPIVTCLSCSEGIIHFPNVELSDIRGRGNLSTFRATVECSECENRSLRTNTAPRYMTIRIVVTV